MTDMTVLETTKLTPDELKTPSRDLIAQLPTILDVVEYISALENVEMRKLLALDADFLNMHEMGRYMPVADQPRSNVTRFYPCSQTPFLYMRGQNSFHSPSYPSLFRKKGKESDDYQLISRLRACEFILSFITHPVVREVERNCRIERMAIAQHYEIPTEYMDITNSKWVAAFFAASYKEGDRYLPTKTGFGKGIGVFYISNPKLQNTPSVTQNITPLGFQYFERPTRQSSFVYKMNKGDDFDESKQFVRIVFRHDTEASKVVFAMSYRQQRFYPDDEWVGIANWIRRDDYPLSMGALELSRQFGVTQTVDEVREVLRRKGLALTDQLAPLAQLTSAQVELGIRRWEEYERSQVTRKISNPLPIFYL